MTKLILTTLLIGQTFWTVRAINHESIALAFTIASNQFGFDLLQQLSVKNYEQKENILFSPLILEISLSMIYARSQGNTKYQMENVLNFYESPCADNIIDAIQTIQNNLNETNWIYLNLMAINSTENLNPDYKIFMEENYQAKIINMMNDMEDLKNQINQFVIPNAMINKLITTLHSFNLTSINDDNDRKPIALINMATFQTKWLESFDQQQTQIGYFHSSNGEKYSNIQYILIEMDLNRIHRSLSSLYLYHLIEKLNQTFATEFALFLPRMNLCITYENLVDDFEKMGINDLFHPYRSNLTDDNLFNNKTNQWIDRIYHQSQIQMNEYGIGNDDSFYDLHTMDKIIVEKRQSLPVLKFDHPFIFFINHIQSGQILFLGEIQRL
ncbi:hypothetical protein DERP_013084 [Dermatophagoides pteronyssinus]|uniref:Serpin domain-containing protein n=1 Tax=Dermatophagoides pteronyssinus TaxID=6956 RepID=A0ABQ8J5H4_DERPT|nr:hypothetical protein DERP_013084 [Dermatophagoides pteronyssinus]